MMQFLKIKLFRLADKNIILNSDLYYNLCQVNSVLLFGSNECFSRLFSTAHGDASGFT